MPTLPGSQEQWRTLLYGLLIAVAFTVVPAGPEGMVGPLYGAVLHAYLSEAAAWLIAGVPFLASATIARRHHHRVNALIVGGMFGLTGISGLLWGNEGIEFMWALIVIAGVIASPFLFFRRIRHLAEN